MKALLLMAGLALYSGLAFGQQKKVAPAASKRQVPTMLGIGPFKIGKTTIQEIPAICTAAKISLQESYSLHKTREAGDSTIAFMVPYVSDDEYADASSLSSPDPTVTVFYFREYTVADILISELTLRFYKGVLYEISTPFGNNLADAFRIKYGPPELRTLTTPSTCFYKLTGSKVVHEDKSFFERWYNGAVVALSYIGTTRDSNCNEETYGRFSVANEGVTKAVEANEKVLLKAIQAKSKAKSKSKLSEL